jgi:serine protease Do
LTCPAFAKLPLVEDGKPLPSNLFVELNKTVNPAVVNISTETKPKAYGQNPWGGSAPSEDPMEELLRQFFGGGMSGGQMQPRSPSFSLGTGFIISEDGLIITNSHVVDKADVINIQLSEKDETVYPATIIGQDPKTDIALIKIDAKKKLPTVKLGKSADLLVGEWVAAFGNPYGHGHSMTKGIVSALGRDLDELNLFPFIQTDASINPGNSGGPLVNVRGEVVGVNTAIDARAQGIGFAIPIDEVKTIINQLKESGSVSRGFLGVSMQTMNEDIARDLRVKQKVGALIVEVLAGSAADKAGLQAYDIITRVNTTKIESSSDLSRAITRIPIGKKAKLEFYRAGKLKTLYATLKSNPETKATFKRVTPKPPLPKSKESHLYKTYGFEIAELTPALKREFEIENNGKHTAVVERVVGYSKASRAGLRAGDIIYEINRKPIFSAKSVTSYFSSSKSSFLLRIKRGKAFAIIRIEK